MKKTLLAIAVLGACAMTAQAANVTLYGAVDAGFAYNHVKVKAGDKSVTTNSFKIADGLAGSNKIGIKGEEDLGNMKVGFKLENGFHIANGAMKSSGVLFDREARMYVKSGLGEIGAGRFGGLASAAGSYGIFFSNADAFDGGDNEIKDGFAQSGRMDNSIAYQSPEIAGFQATMMYSFNEKGAQVDKMKNNARYIGAGLTYNYEKLNLVGVVEGHILAKNLTPNNKDITVIKDKTHKNSFTYNLGANYDFGVAKVFAGGQISRYVNYGSIESGFVFGKDDASKALFNSIQFNGYALTLGAQIPVSGDQLTVGSYYGNYKNAFDIAKDPAHGLTNDIAKKNAKFRVYGLSTRFEHNLSKRSSIYVGAGIGQAQMKANGEKAKRDVAQVYAGLHHNF